MEDTLKKIEVALKEFIKDEGFLLKYDLSEQCITHKLANKIDSKFIHYDVDCEYNGNVESDGGKKKVFLLMKNCLN